MADTWGNRIKLSIFGESHGTAIGIVVDGLPAGTPVDEEAIKADMARRAPGHSPMATARKEADLVEIVSGVYNGKTTGTSICGIIRNTDARSRDYGTIMRPGHADLTALFRYGGHADMRGGGHFSGRLTAPLVFAGALAKQVLQQQGIAIHARICSIGPVQDDLPENHLANASIWAALQQKELPVFSARAQEAMQQCILSCKNELDSVGGVIEVAAFGVPTGWGDPFFNSIESVASSLFFSIPAVKGVEFGDGFALSALCGSQSNDPITLENGAPTTVTNRCGGILGGITTGRPVYARLGIKPTASILQPQQSVDAQDMSPATLQIKGRHDPCIVPRAVPVAEAALALALLDVMPEGGRM